MLRCPSTAAGGSIACRPSCPTHHDCPCKLCALPTHFLSPYACLAAVQTLGGVFCLVLGLVSYTLGGTIAVLVVFSIFCQVSGGRPSFRATRRRLPLALPSCVHRLSSTWKPLLLSCPLVSSCRCRAACLSVWCLSCPSVRLVWCPVSPVPAVTRAVPSPRPSSSLTRRTARRRCVTDAMLVARPGAGAVNQGPHAGARLGVGAAWYACGLSSLDTPPTHPS